MNFPSSFFFPFLLAVGLLAPGWLLGKYLGGSRDPLTAFLGSAAVLFNLLVVMDTFDVTLNRDRVSLGLVIACSVFAMMALIRPRKAGGVSNVVREPWCWRNYYWLILPTFVGFSAIVFAVIADPLSGFDTSFRWDFLATQMMREGNLHFYPAISTRDFHLYAWCDGIAPLVSSLYFWAYLSLGKTAIWVTIPVVIGEALLLFWAVYQLASLRGGAPAGMAATALLATSPVLLWGVAMGQETGLTALSLVAMFLFIERDRAAPRVHWLIWAGMAAGIGALAREYGLAFIGLGAMALACRKVSKRGWLEFLITAILVALPWYLRNWYRTGNPLYSHSLGGLFPSNPIQDEYSQTIKSVMGLSTAESRPGILFGLVCTLAGVPLVLGLAHMISAGRAQAMRLFAVLLVVGLWVWSINETSGGAIYSLRVLTPAIALCAASGGEILVRWFKARLCWVFLLVVLVSLAVDAAERSLFMPFNPTVHWWSKSPFAWENFRDHRSQLKQNPDWGKVATAADSFEILVIDPYSFTILTQLEAHPVSLYSPSVRFLFEPDVQLVPSLSRLRSLNVRFVLINYDHILVAQLMSHHFFSALSNIPPTMQSSVFSVYDLYSDDLWKRAGEYDLTHAH